MATTTQTVALALGALLTGLFIPLVVQLFLVLRNVRRTTAVFDQRLDQTLRDLGDVVAELKRVSVPAPTLAAQLAAALPTLIAGVRAFRAGDAAHEAAAPAAAIQHGKAA